MRTMRKMKHPYLCRAVCGLAMALLMATWGCDDDPEKDENAVATPCTNGLAGVYPCRGVELLAHLPLEAIGGVSDAIANDVWGWTDAASGKSFALVGLSNGTALVDVTQPVRSRYVGLLPTMSRLRGGRCAGRSGGACGDSTWRGVKAYADHAFVVSEEYDHGLQVLDLRQLLSVSGKAQVFAETAHFAGFGSAHNIAVNEESGFAYAVGSDRCAGGLFMIDVRVPAQPTYAGCYDGDGYTHDVQCVIYRGPDARYAGREICFASNEDTVTIVDVTAKDAPRQLGRQTYEGVGFVHQGWLTEDQRYFLSDDELDEVDFGHPTRTYIWDMGDLERPAMIGYYQSQSSAIDHNLFIRGSRAYAANYRSGLRVFDLAGVAAARLEEIAFFDIYPASDDAVFSGAWNVYPYFPDGTIVVSGIEQGLFVLALEP
ncbi:MAG: choice-of-anchor B family protein [Candidatus Schekmanbacteria bacterium]|nr:choice-of-anchor B family protein [Candidatus Schekmanbacteria bacterium]